LKIVGSTSDSAKLEPHCKFLDHGRALGAIALVVAVAKGVDYPMLRFLITCLATFYVAPPMVPRCLLVVTGIFNTLTVLVL
jgi:hypothetical protein